MDSARNALDRAVADRLIADGKLDAAAADRAFRLQANGQERLEQILTTLGLVHEKDVARAVAAELGLPLAAPADYPDAVVLDAASPKFLRQARVLPLAETADSVIVAMADPLDLASIRSFELLSGKTVLIRVAAPSDLDFAHFAPKGRNTMAVRRDPHCPAYSSIRLLQSGRLTLY